MRQKVTAKNKALLQIAKKFKYHYSKQEISSALKYAKKAHYLDPQEITHLSDAATCCIHLAKWKDAIKYSLQILKIDNQYLNAFDALAHAYYCINELDKSRYYGLKAIYQRDCMVVLKNTTLPNLIKKKQTGYKKIIAFSLFGDNPYYLEPAILNCLIQKKLLPDWVCRFYIDNSVPDFIKKRILLAGGEIIKVSSKLKAIPATMWRFLAIDDPNASAVLCRDADSVISHREVKLINQWLQSDKKFHAIRDAGSHTELLLAGLWGVKSNSLPTISPLILQFLSQQKISKRFADQHFLRYFIWPYARNNILIHDSLFQTINASPIKALTIINKKHFHIGACESGITFNLKLNKKQQTATYWELWSKIDPIPNSALKFSLYKKARLVARYNIKKAQTTICASIPYRYGIGLADNTTFIKLV